MTEYCSVCLRQYIKLHEVNSKCTSVMSVDADAVPPLTASVKGYSSDLCKAQEAAGWWWKFFVMCSVDTSEFNLDSSVGHDISVLLTEPELQQPMGLMADWLPVRAVIFCHQTKYEWWLFQCLLWHLGDPLLFNQFFQTQQLVRWDLLLNQWCHWDKHTLICLLDQQSVMDRTSPTGKCSNCLVGRKFEY